MAQAHHTISSRMLAVFVLAAFFNIHIIQCASAAEPENPWPEAAAFFEQIQKRHPIDLGFQGIKEFEREPVIFVEIAKSDRRRFYSFLKVFEQELAKYPSGFFAKSDLSKIIFVKKLFFEGKPAQGVYRSIEGIMYFDIYRHFGNQGAQRHGIHHELFHMVDASLRQRMAKGEADLMFSNKEAAAGGMKDPYGWAALNDPNFKYEREGQWHKGRNELNFFAPPKSGFASDYSFVSVEEDMAEVYASLFIQSEHQLLHQWAQRDVILASKLEKMKAVLQRYSPHINSQFWEDLLKSK